MIFRGNVLDVVGHRGWPRRFPDNTLAGMGAAFGVVDMVETDVRRTADGVLVLSHDPSLLGLVVAESTWADLAQVDLGGGLRPIRLDEALAAFPDRRFDLEV
jgi:glycerophosphoryl diester phosphodiesterase